MKKLRRATPEEIAYTAECRTKVKEANFSILYGGGAKTLAAALRKADNSLTEKESLTLAKKLIDIKKGKKNQDGIFYGGADSDAHNAMYSIAYSHDSSLPGLGTKISEALRVSKVGHDFITSRTNFCIQASGAEMLSSILVAILALCKQRNIEAYYCISIHD